MPIFSESNPPIIVRTIYTPGYRQYLRETLAKRRADLDVGMTRYHAEITKKVHANRRRILCETGKTGIFVDCLGVRTLGNFFHGRRTADSTVTILDAYDQLLNEEPDEHLTLH